MGAVNGDINTRGDAAAWSSPARKSPGCEEDALDHHQAIATRKDTSSFTFSPLLSIYNIMLGGLLFVVATTALAATPGFASTRRAYTDTSVPSLDVPACPAKAAVTYNKSVPDQADFNLTQVELCYDSKAIQIAFTAFNETNFHFNPNHTTNDFIFLYEVMEAFISPGFGDPSTYLEFEVSPNNVTFNSFIMNPSKIRAEGSPFAGAYISGNLPPAELGMTATTELDRAAETWKSTARIPLFLFNVDDGKARGTKWRMNFFRTITSPDTFPDQRLGAWSPPNQANFHMTPFFGRVTFV